MKKINYSDLVPKNCGVKLRSKEESTLVIKEKLETLVLEGKQSTFLAKVYFQILAKAKEPAYA